MRIMEQEYLPHVKEHSRVVVQAKARVKETGQIYSQSDIIMIQKPSLVLKAWNE